MPSTPCQLLTCATWLAVAAVAIARQPDYTLYVDKADVSPDCTVRPSYVFNGSSPAPTLYFTEGQSAWVRVINNSTDQNSTVHFHGLSQFLSPYADGTPLTSQWPIAPSSYFDYEFNLTDGSAGTYFYHSHVGLQLLTAYGAVVVRDKDPPPVQYDEELIIQFGDAYHASDNAIVAGLLNTTFSWLGEPQALLVNGNAYGRCNTSSTVTQCTNTCHQHVIEVNSNTTYRVRAIGTSTLTYPFVAFEGHNQFAIFEADGQYLQPVNASWLEISSGQRYDFLLKTKSEAELQQLGRRTFWGRVETRWRPVRDQGSFLLTYRLANGSVDPNVANMSFGFAPENLNQTVFLPNENSTWVDNRFVAMRDEVPPLEALPPANSVTRNITVTATQLTFDMTKIGWFTNGVMKMEGSPPVPYLVQAYDGSIQPNYTIAEANNGYDTSTQTFPIRLGETVEIEIQNVAGTSGVLEAHPWHFHGQHPWLTEVGVLLNGSRIGAPFTWQTTQHSPNEPVRRDTQVVWPGYGASYIGSETLANGTVGGYARFRMQANVPGFWLVHCHIQPHQIMGMAAVFWVGNTSNLPPLSEDFRAEYLMYDPPRRSNQDSGAVM